MYYNNKLGVNRELAFVRVLLTKRTHTRRVATSLEKVNQNTLGFFTLLRVHPPTTHDTVIFQYQH